MSESCFDAVIIGQGLAGSALAWMLIGAGQRICVIDDGHRSSSSAVAAGLINPLAGMRFNRRPELRDWLAAADHWYAELGDALGPRFYHPLPMLRLFRSAGQTRFHARRLADPDSRDLLDAALDGTRLPEPVAGAYGGFIQHRTGFVDMPLLLDAVRARLLERGALRVRDVDYATIAPGSGTIDVDGLRTRRLICCDGARLRFNPWFCDLPLAPEKGEILNLQIDGWRPRHIINGAHWIVPQDNGELRLGATHEHHRIDQVPTAAGRQELLAGLKAMLPPPAGCEVTRHLAGIRPGTRDRYPLIGRHPEHPALWVFNGFGARGALTIPWYAGCLVRHLLADAPLPREADIRRFA